MTMQFSALIREVAGGCFHPHVAWPQHNRQRPLSCGSWRVYDLNRGIRGERNPPERPHLLQHAPSPVLTVCSDRAGMHTHGCVTAFTEIQCVED